MSNETPSVILTVNVRSSSLKFSLYRMRRSANGVDCILFGQMERIVVGGRRLVVRDDRQAILVERQIKLPNYEVAIEAMPDWVNSTLYAQRATIAGAPAGTWGALAQPAPIGSA